MTRRAVILAACITLAGCGGGGGSNDQGVSFRALGVFQEIQEQVAPAADTLPTVENHPGDSGRVISLSTTVVVPTDLNGDGDLDGGFIGMQNNLATQSVNVQGIQTEIFIPGALIPNPVVTDFVPLAVSLAHAPAPGSNDPPSQAFVQTLFVSADTMAFLNQNQTLLPPTPFNMNVVMTLEAVSDSGDTFDSNEITYGIVVLP